MPITDVRLGQFNNAGDPLAGFLKIFGGEVYTEFEKSTQFKDKHIMRPIENGRSASFPLIGGTTVQLHTPGTQITTDVIPQNETIINVEGKVTSSVAIPDIDEAMLHYEVRGPFSREIGMSLAEYYDYNVALSILLAARGASQVTGRAGGTALTNAAYATTGSTLADGLFAAAEALDTKRVPSGERWAAFRPAQYYLLTRLADFTSIDKRGTADLSQGTIDTAAGIKIMKVLKTPGTNEIANAKLPAHLKIDASVTTGLVWTQPAAGSVQLMALQQEAERRIDYQDYLIVASYVAGWNRLRSDCAVELRTGAPA